MQTELANRESSLLVSVQNVSIAENNLKQLIAKDATAPEWSAQITPTDTPKFDATPVNLNDALKKARENRPELRRLRLQNDINKIDLQFFKNQRVVLKRNISKKCGRVLIEAARLLMAEDAGTKLR